MDKVLAIDLTLILKEDLPDLDAAMEELEQVIYEHVKEKVKEVSIDNVEYV